MILKGAKILFLGDSITEGCGTSGEDHRFTTLLSRKYGLVAENYGIGGTRYARQFTPSENPIIDRDYCQRYLEMDPQADAVVVFGGTNDYGHGDAPFGAPGDTTADTYYGACHQLYTGLKQRYGNAKILILTPMHRCNETSHYGDGGHACRPVLSEYVRVQAEMAPAFGFAVLDLFGMGLLDPNDPAVREAYVPDGLHPNDAGHVILAQAIGEKLEEL